MTSIKGRMPIGPRAAYIRAGSHAFMCPDCGCPVENARKNQVRCRDCQATSRTEGGRRARKKVEIP